MFIQNIFTEDFITYDANQIFEDILKKQQLTDRKIDFKSFSTIFLKDFPIEGSYIANRDNKY
jgi:hypothetical protein